MPESFENECELAIEAVRQASLVCRRVQSQIDAGVLEKKDRSPVTVADYASQAVICRSLALKFPADAIIAEEDAAELRDGPQAEFCNRILAELTAAGIDSNAGQLCDWIDRGRNESSVSRFWTLDPIDGTKGFLRGEQYAVSLALIVDGLIRVGVLGCPNLPVDADRTEKGAIFYAVAGKGVFSIPLDGKAAPRRLAVRKTTDTRHAVMCESVESGHSDHDVSRTIADSLGIGSASVRMDSQAKYATVARGDADLYLRLPTRADYREKIWDHAGGALVVEEAGGRVTDIAGQPLDWTQGRALERNRGVIVTNGALHAEVIDAVSKAGVR